MSNTSMILTTVVLGIGVGAFIALFIFRKRQLEKLFNQVFEVSRQVPKQKKNSFLLLMFKESVPKSKAKAKKNANSNILSNPKYLEVQLLQMANVLKDPSRVKDKTLKKALNILKDYQAWERKKNGPKNKPV